MDEKHKIMFMGTPEFAVPSLELLVQSGLNLIAVITQPDRPKGRGRRQEPPPVKLVAEKHGIPVYQPERVRDESFLGAFRQMAPDMVILVAFGQILPGEIIHYPRLGCVNLHPSLLPKYRGAAPINWALIHGETVTGVSIIEMCEKVDAGKILLQRTTPIGPEEAFGELHERLSREGARLLLEAVRGIFSGSITGKAQDESRATYAPRFKKEDTRLDWNRDFVKIVNCIRGLSPVPAAYTCLDKKQLKIFAAAGEEGPVAEPAGTVLPATERGLPVAARNGHVYLGEVQMEGRKRMPIREFLKGYEMVGKKLQ